MSIVVERLNKIKFNINKNVNIIAVSKTFPLEIIEPLIADGHKHFGENKVQEAISKWSSVKLTNTNIKLHMIGKLQSNKSKLAVKLFDYIHSLDNQKLADKLSSAEKESKKNLKYFIQVNLGNEQQKSGIAVSELDQFYSYCSKELNMDVIGLMSIPPNDDNTEKYFKYISELNYSLGFNQLSLGMSGDYSIALKYKTTFLRIGSSIFGKRI